MRKWNELSEIERALVIDELHHLGTAANKTIQSILDDDPAVVLDPDYTSDGEAFRAAADALEAIPLIPEPLPLPDPDPNEEPSQ
jgi:hypothetical protein